MKKILKQTITNKTRILTSLLLLSLTLLFCLATVSAAPGDTIYVNGSGNDSWDGLSTTHTDGTLIGPKLSIKNATKTVNTGGTIHIANGQYTDENNTMITIDKNMNIIGESQSGTIINGTGTNWIFIINSGATVTLTNLTITNATKNSGSSAGSAIYNYGILTVSNCTFTGNSAQNGGAINNYLQGNCNVIGCTFTDNTAVIMGGAIINYAALSVTGCTFTNNTAHEGGAISNFYGNCNVNCCTFTGNSAINPIGIGDGGAIFNPAYHNGILTAHYNRFYNNTATTRGNAISSYGSADANYNWWGSNKDPKSIDKLIYDPSNLVNTTNWVILTVNANPTIINNTQTTIITSDLNHYTNNTGYIGELSTHIPDGINVIYSSTLGLVSSGSEITNNGQTQTTFTPNCYSGLATVHTTVDDFSLDTPITITNSNIYVSNNTGSDTTGDGSQYNPYQTIKKGISTLTAGGTIHIANGQYTGQNNTLITIDKNMNIIGESQSGTIINGTGTNRIFTINSGATVTLTNLTLTNATSTARGAIYNQGTLTATNCTFTNNTVTITYINIGGGGAIYNKGTIISLSGCTFTNNNASYDGSYNIGGGAIYNQGTINSLIDCNFTKNTATHCGGAINNQGTIISLSGCIFTNNTATNDGYGGAIYNYQGTITSLNGCNFTNNTATTNGGAICNTQGNITSISSCNFTSNNATNGGAIRNWDGNLTAQYNRFYNNTATTYGTAIYCLYGSVNATLNWWGSNSPQDITNLIVAGVGGSVNASTWVILTVNANPTTIYSTQTTIITADLNHYTNNTGYIGELSNHIPDGIQVIFSLTNGPLGSFNGLTSPVTLFTSEGLASILFNAASTGIQNIEASTDNEKVSASITINDVASTGDFVWNDINKDGIQDAGEPGIPGVTVNLYNSTGEIIATTTTNAAGHYLFNNIIPGTYSLGFVLPIGYKFSSQNQGTDDTKDSDVDVTTGKTITKTLLSEENDLTWDAGMYMIPVAVDDTATTYEDISLTSGNVAGNDVPSGDGGNVWSVVSGPDHGTVTMTADGTYTYTPDPNYNGHDQFKYKITDANGDVSTATVTITVTPVNDPPTVGNYDVTTQEDTQTTGTVIGNDVDSSLTYSLGTQASNGIATVNPDGTWTYTPKANYNGRDSFTVTVNDGNGGFATATVTITVNPVNDAPVAVNDGASTDEDNSVDVDVLANDTDVDTGDTLSINSFTQPGNGTTSLVGGKIRYTPNPNWYGTDTFTYTTRDNSGAISNTATVTITINPVNDAPIAQNDSKTIDEDSSATGKVTASDVDEDTLTYSVGTGSESPQHGTVNLNSTTGAYTYTPNSNWHGTDSFTVLVSDGNGGTAVSTVTITVNSVNDIPVAQNDTATTKEGKSTNINVLSNDSDADGDSLTVTNVTQPNHGTAAINADGTITYTPNSNWYGTDSFTYTVSDGNGGTTTATVTITVNQAVSNLYIKTTTSSQNPTIGETFRLTYKLGNNGPDAAENVTITFQLPEGLDFINIRVDNGKYTYDPITRTVTWTLNSVPVGDPYLYLTVKAADDGTYKITPNITSDTYNLNSGDYGIITFNIQPNNSNSGDGTGTNTVNAASKTTIGLQKTGLPLNYLILAILMVLSGLIPKRK